jgi:hypothetical protein
MLDDVLKHTLKNGKRAVKNGIKNGVKNGVKNGNGNGIKNGINGSPISRYKKTHKRKIKLSLSSTEVVEETYIPNAVNFAADDVQRKFELGTRTLPITDRIIKLSEVSDSLKNRYRNTLRQYYKDHGNSLIGHQSDPNVGTLKVAGQEIRGKMNTTKGVRSVKLKNKQKDIEEQARRKFAEGVQTVDPKHRFTGGHHRFELSLGAAITDGIEENQLKPFWKLVQQSYPNLFPGNHPYNQIPFERGFTKKLHAEVHRRLNAAGLDPNQVVNQLAGKTAGQKFAFMNQVSKVLEEIDDFMAKEMRRNRAKGSKT